MAGSGRAVDHQLMKLFLVWLIGVPTMVAAMVLARAVSPQGLRGAPPAPPSQAQVLDSCRGQLDLDKMPPTVPDQRHRVTCHRMTIQ